jgi:hypothetical protein
MSGIEKAIIAMILICIVYIVFLFGSIAKKQEADKTIFMNGCLVEKKQYECDVLWSQTDASKQMRDAQIGLAVGMAIGAMAGRK